MKWLLALIFCAGLASAEEAVLQSDFTWRHDDAHFGGFSGLWMADDGARLVAISDSGRMVEAEVRRQGGVISGLNIAAFRPLGTFDNAAARGGDRDAEGLTRGADGRFYVSFEGLHRVQRYDEIDAKGAWMHGAATFRDLQLNSGMEALAMDAKGMLYAIPERSGAWERPFPVFRQTGTNTWDRSWSIPRSGTFLVVGAEFGPDGRLYVLERDFKWYLGFATRIRRFDAGPDGFFGEETVLETRFGKLDNMEGIDLRRDATGAIIISLISDDNYHPLQRTRVVEYRLRDASVDG